MTTQTPPYPAPDFNLPDHNGKTKQLSDFNGKWLVLYFYPKDDTPGCTTQACSLRDSYQQITDLGAEIIGISKDDTKSHQKFIAKHSLNFTLFSDETGKTIQAYGAWGNKMFGKLGILRKTFLIDPAGNVQKVYGRAIPEGHGDKVAEDLKRLINKG